MKTRHASFQKRRAEPLPSAHRKRTREGTKSGPLKGCWTACFSVLQLWPKFIEQLGRLTAKVKCKRCCNMNSSIFHPQHVNESKIVQKPGSYLWYWVARSVSWVSCQQYCQLAALCLLSLHGHCRHTCRFAGSKQEPFRGRWPRATQWFHGALYAWTTLQWAKHTHEVGGERRKIRKAWRNPQPAYGRDFRLVGPSKISDHSCNLTTFCCIRPFNHFSLRPFKVLFLWVGSWWHNSQLLDS